ncbi:IS110 family transposase, partial [Pseudonocardia pini]|uniref:IS110 family transposase n=1 Tax=Pseudonocardia pini TaxID=2758030 RepID=UPI0015F00953
MSVAPKTPPSRPAEHSRPSTPTPTSGIDWASTDHAVAVVAPDGTAMERFTVTHTRPGLRGLCRRLRRAGVTEVGIERGDGPVVETLLAAGFTVFVIPPLQVKNLRGRYGSAGNKDDRFDAYVLADTVRTDRHRLRPLTLDTPATITLRATCRARKDLVTHRIALANQLRAHLAVAFPGAVGLFSDIDSKISLRFLRRFPDQQRAGLPRVWLSAKRLAAWLHSVGYSGHTSADTLHQRLADAPHGLTGDGGARAQITLALITALEAITAQIQVLADQIEEQLALHPDAEIFRAAPPGSRRPP